MSLEDHLNTPVVELDVSVEQIGFCADIHSNSTDLFVMLMKDESINHWFCAGDVVDMTAQPNDDRPTVAMMRKFNIRSVLGNHDAYVVKHRLHDFREEMDRTYLSSLPFTLKIQMHSGLKIQIFHASPKSLEAVVTPDRCSDEAFRSLFGHLDADVIVLGHSHHPFQKRIDLRYQRSI